MKQKTLKRRILSYAAGSILLLVGGYPATAQTTGANPLTGQKHSDRPPAAMVPGNGFTNAIVDTVDGVLFTIATDKKRYRQGDTVLVRYRIANHTMGTVLYDFTTSCQFDIRVSASRGKNIYSLLGTTACEPGTSHLTLAPSSEKLTEPAGIPLKLKENDTLTVKAQMAGYPLSTATVNIVYESTPAQTAPVALEGSSGTQKPDLEFNSDTKMLVIRVNRAQRLTISAFILTGKKVNKLSCERFLEPGTHLISFNNSKLIDGVVIFKVEGAGFSETKTINLSH